MKITNIKKSKVLLSCLLAFILFLGCIMPVFAEGAGGSGPISGGASAITKILQMPIGTTTPDAAFEFGVTAVSADGVDAIYDDSDETKINMPGLMPEIADVTIDYSSLVGKKTTTKTDGDIKSVIIESDNIFATTTFLHAGVYVYEITEKTPADDQYNETDGKETMEYSGAKYTLNVYVKEGTGANAGTYYIFAIGTIITDKDNEDQTEDFKVDSSPRDPSTSGDYSDMIFTNTYTKTNTGTDPTDPAQATLYISKTVSGDYSSDTVYFNFNLTVYAPSSVSQNLTPSVYKAYIVDDVAGTLTVVNAATLKDTTKNNVKGTGVAEINEDKNYISITQGEQIEFSLKHNQRLVFLDTPVGTHYEVEEAGTAEYTPTVTVFYNGNSNVSPGFVQKGSSGSPLAIPQDSKVTDTLYVGESASSAKFDNNRNDVTPTGINISDLPFIGMIILAIGALTGYIVYKYRKTRKNGNIKNRV
ncbi:MAG: hypothetical protein FWD71_19550 [Oscillospiraceae bacterium]|nr:hypothetical protein [Oscillospiraceae bacterium]